ncbi:MAG: zinc metallopeptidase [Candidatus Melainabacteria bacterium]
MYFGDPLYMLIMLIGAGLVFIPQMWVKNTVARFLEVPGVRGLTGREVAEDILRQQGISNVAVEEVSGQLSDHYDLRDHRVRLSPDIYHGQSVASVAIAAHEVGHAIQHATGYYPVVARSALAPVAGLGSQLGGWLLIIGLGLGVGAQAGGLGLMMAWLGVLLFGLGVLFHIVTLPVEINASMRAVRILETGNYLNAQELPGARKVLTAAAFTYVAVALYSLMQLGYWLLRLLGRNRD